MPSSKEVERDLFFDSSDYLSSSKGEEQYRIWMSEPDGVQKRREKFLQRMDLIEFGLSRSSTTSTCISKDKDMEVEFDDPSKTMELERVLESSGAVPSSGYSPSSYESKEEEDEEEEGGNGFSYSSQECKNLDMCKRKVRSLWKFLLSKRKGMLKGVHMSNESKPNQKKTPKRGSRVEVKQNRKKFLELSALYYRQEIQAHKGFIWTIKFSPDGKYLASGGEDGVVRVWTVFSIEGSDQCLRLDQDNFDGNFRQGKSRFFKKESNYAASIVVPKKVFRIEESPLQEFHGHLGDVLDIAWSNSNCLLSASIDGTVRLWQVGSEQCLNIFHHKNYVTCVEFNPLDENHFISGSIDGRARIWGVLEKRVVDWTDFRDVITAISYQPDGKGFAVGSITGTCRVYETSGEYLQVALEININGRKKASSGKRITGIQFSREKPQRLMITSEDSKLRIFDGIDIIHKCKGLPKSGRQMSASFTSSKQHIVSIGDDSHVYIWNYDGLSSIPSSTKEMKRSGRCCERFFSKGVSVAIPWQGMGTEEEEEGGERRLKISYNGGYLSQMCDRSERFSLGNWISMDSQCKGSVTWPEEKLPYCDPRDENEDPCHVIEGEQEAAEDGDDWNKQGRVFPLETWGLVIVTAGWDGVIRTYQNYGLPCRI